MFESFQEMLEDLGHQGYCGNPFGLDRRPYGALAVELGHGTNPLQLGAQLMQEIIQGRPQMMDEDDLESILETAEFEMRGRALLVFWPDLKYTQA